MILNRELSYTCGSAARRALMGFAIICIMLCHSTVSFSGELGRHISEAMHQFFQFGVDIFFFLSGLGLYCSFSENSNPRLFYKKRFLRIMPAYFTVTAAGFIIRLIARPYELEEYLHEHTLVSFYTDNVLTVWFIAAIVTLYLIFPLLYLLLKQRPKIFAVLLILSIIIPVTLSLMEHWKLFSVTWANGIFFIRIPVFLAGMMYAQSLRDGKTHRIKLGTALLALLLSSGAFILNVTFNRANMWVVSRLIFGIIAVCTVFILGTLFTEHSNGRAVHVLNELGAVTLNIYLINEPILRLCEDFLGHATESTFLSSLLINAAAAALAVCCAFLMSFLFKKFRLPSPNLKPCPKLKS